MKRECDTPGGVRWLKYAERIARALKGKYQVKRQIKDGYIIEGRRANKQRIARVLDIPGRLLPVRPRSMTIGGIGSIGYPPPFPTSAPNRGATLGKKFDGDTAEFVFIPPEDPSIQYRVIGNIPSFTTSKPIGITDPVATPRGVVATRLIYSSAAPDPSINLTDFTIDYRFIGQLFVTIDVWGAGGGGDLHLMIEEQIIVNLFGCPIIQQKKVPYNNTTNAETRAWATAHNGTVVLALRLSENTRPFGVTSSLGIVVLQKADEVWGVSHSYKLPHSDLSHVLFAPHTRVDQSTGAPLSPTQLSGFYMTSTGVAMDKYSFVLTAVIGQEVDGYATLIDGLRYGTLNVTGVLRYELKLSNFSSSHTISQVCTDAAASAGAIDLSARLETTNGSLVSLHIDSPWTSPVWPVHCTALYIDNVLHELKGYALGLRGDIFSPPSSSGGRWRGTNTYNSPAMMFTLDSTSYDENGVPTTTSSTITTNAFGVTPQVAPGNIVSDYGSVTDVVGVELGQVQFTQASYIGLNGFELPMYRGDSSTPTIARLELDPIRLSSELFLPNGATRLHASCYTVRTLDTENNVTPHRSVVVYRISGTTTIQFREGDGTIIEATGISDSFPLGVYYIGNQFANAPYGGMRTV